MAVKAKGQITLTSLIDVKAVYWYYLLQGSTLSAPGKPTTYPPPTSWDDSEPPYVEGSTNSLYFVECTVFCDDTFSYSEVSLSSSYEAAKQAYNKAAAALKNTITGVDVKYAQGTSNTTAPTSGWTTTAPAWISGQYMWQKTVITYGDDKTTESDPVCISGAVGAKGDSGDAGIGIKSIVEQYYRSSSATSLSGGSWSSSYPGWADGTYIWTRSVITYTDNSTDDTTAICVTGSKGSTGDTGATGTGVASIEAQFYLSTSKTTQTGGSWSSTMPEWVSGKYLWTRNKITYQNPTSEDYTDPRCDSSWEAAYDVKTEIEQHIDNITLSVINADGVETSVTLSDGALDLSVIGGKIADAAKTATDYMSYDATNGLQIGHKNNNGTWTGYRTRISSGSFDILTGANTKVASFGGSSVSLCGDEFKIIHTPGTLAYTSITSGNLHFGADTIWLDSPEGSTANYVRLGEGSLAVRVNSDDPSYNTEIMITDEVAVDGKVSATSESVTWIKGRDGAAFKSTVQPGSTGSYQPLTSMKSYSGSWETGVLGDVFYFVYGTDANYNAETNTTMNSVRIHPDGTLYCGNANVKGLSLVTYAGETLTCNTCVCPGHLTNGKDTIFFTVPLPKMLDTSHNNLTVTAFKANIRKAEGGYIGASTSFVSGGYDYLNSSNYTVAIDNYCSPLSVRMYLKNKTSTFDAANNSPVAVDCYVQFRVN